MEQEYKNEKRQPKPHFLRESEPYKGITVMYFGHPEITSEGKPAEVACVQALGLQITRPTFRSGANLPPYNEKEFAEYARRDIAERVINGE